MELKEIYSHLEKSIAQIHLHQRFMRKVVSEEVTELYKGKDALAADLEEDYMKSHNKMFFYKLDSREIHIYGHTVQGIDDRVEAAIFHSNRHNQWFLAEAFEEFSSYCERLYAYVGVRDNNFWSLSDYGKTTLNDISQLPYKAFEEKAKSLKGSPNCILEKFRKRYQGLADVEKNNSSQIDIALFVELIAQFRHVIVHKRGIVSCRDAFDERVMSNAKVKGKSQIESAKSAIDQFFFGEESKSKGIIWLGDVSFKKAC